MEEEPNVVNSSMVDILIYKLLSLILLCNEIPGGWERRTNLIFLNK